MKKRKIWRKREQYVDLSDSAHYGRLLKKCPNGGGQERENEEKTKRLRKIDGRPISRSLI